MAAGTHESRHMPSLRCWDYVLAKPELYLDEMTDFIWDRFELDVSEDSIRRSLKANGWTKKKIRQVARERRLELRDACLHELSE